MSSHVSETPQERILEHRVLELYRDPEGERYGEHLVLAAGDRVITAAAGLAISIDDLLP